MEPRADLLILCCERETQSFMRAVAKTKLLRIKLRDEADLRVLQSEWRLSRKALNAKHRQFHDENRLLYLAMC